MRPQVKQSRKNHPSEGSDPLDASDLQEFCKTSRVQRSCTRLRMSRRSPVLSRLNAHPCVVQHVCKEFVLVSFAASGEAIIKISQPMVKYSVHICCPERVPDIHKHTYIDMHMYVDKYLYIYIYTHI